MSDPLLVAHLVLVSAWGGLVIGEGVMELGARDDASRAHAARLHLWMDLLGELPLILAVLVTGTALALRVWPLSTWHMAKAGCGLVAVTANLLCVGVVVARYRKRDDPAAVRRLGRWVSATGLAIPFFLLAAVMGLTGP